MVSLVPTSSSRHLVPTSSRLLPGHLVCLMACLSVDLDRAQHLEWHLLPHIVVILMPLEQVCLFSVTPIDNWKQHMLLLGP